MFAIERRLECKAPLVAKILSGDRREKKSEREACELAWGKFKIIMETFGGIDSQGRYCSFRVTFVVLKI